MVKTGQYGDPGEEQRAAIRDLVLLVAEEQAFQDRLSLVPVIVKLQQEIDRLTRAVADIGGAVAALTARAPAAIPPEDPAYRLLRWENRDVAAHRWENPVVDDERAVHVTERDTEIPQAEQANWQLTRHS